MSSSPPPQNMTGKTCVITGGTSGIGEAAALDLAQRGANLALLCRSKERGAATQQMIHAAAGRECVTLFDCDFERLADVRRAAGELLDALPRIDVLLNNAGVTMLKREESADGYETTFAVNHLAPFLLTHELLPRLLEQPGARIVNTSSGAHKFARFDLDDLQSQKQFSSMRVYGASKLANIFFTRELAERLGGRDIGVWSFHPGAVATRLGANNGWLAKVVLPITALFFKSPAQGAETGIYLCSEPNLNAPNGTYFVNKKPASISSLAADREVGRKLWRASEQMVGLGDTATWG